MIRGIGRAFARVTHPSKQPDKNASQGIQTSSPSGDTHVLAPVVRRRVELLPPSALGIEPPKIVHIDLTEMTKKGDLAWSRGDYDAACIEYEALAKRFPTQALPIVKLMVAYDEMHESRGFKMAAERLASVLPNSKNQVLAFLALFGDRALQPSHTLLSLSLERALRLGRAHMLSHAPLLQLLLHGQCLKMPLLYYAVDQGTDKDVASMLALLSRLGPAAELAEQKAVALTMADGWGKSDKLAMMLRAGIVPGTAEHLDRLVDRAISDPLSGFFEILFKTCLAPTYTRSVGGTPCNLAQLALLADCSDHTLEKKIKALADHQALHTPILGGEDVMVMAIRRGGRALAAILDSGLEVETRDARSGNTPLIEAAARGSSSSAGVLLGRGASTTAVNNAGLNAADMARLQGFPDIERQMRTFPAQQRFEKVLTLLWGEDYYNTMATVRTNLYALNGEQAANLLTYAAPLLGLGSLPEDFARAEPWTLKSMRAKRLPAVVFVDKQDVPWRSLARSLVAWANQLGALQWQGLTEIVEGLKEPYWMADIVLSLLSDAGMPSEHWKAVASSISGSAYQQLKPAARARVVRTAVSVRRNFGTEGSAALDWLNEASVTGFDAHAYWSVMWDFVYCAAEKGDCAALANFIREDATAKNKMGLMRPLSERLKRIEDYGKHLQNRRDGNTAQEPRGPQRAYDKRANLAQALTQTYRAAVATAAKPWVSRADMDCHPAIGLCLNYFGSASEMERAGDAGTEQDILDMLDVIFGRAQARVLLGTHDAGSRVRKLILSWHPDKVDASRAEVAADMTTLLLSLRQLLERSEMRTKLIAFLNARYPNGAWRAAYA